MTSSSFGGAPGSSHTPPSPAATRHDLLTLAKAVEADARRLGADEAAVTVSRAVQTNLTRRDGRVEQATESTTRGLVLSILVDNRYSTHTTSDMRPAAVHDFLERAIAATRYLEPDPDRRLADPELCGRAVSDEALDQEDPAWAARSADDRGTDAESLEAAVVEEQVPNPISHAVHVGDGSSEIARVASNGFADTYGDAWFTIGAERALTDGDRRPEASAWFGTRYLADLPGAATLAAEVATRVRDRLGSGPIASGTYPLVLLNRAAGRLVGALGGPLSASQIHQSRSFLAGRVGERLGSDLLTITDDPAIPRGLGSRPWDHEGLVAVRRPIFEQGVLRTLYVSVYYGRKLGIPPTTGGRSNWVLPKGERPWVDVARAWPKAILVDGFLGGNSNPVTGDFSFGIRGQLLENGVRTRSLSEMNVSGNLQSIFKRLVALGDDPYPWSSVQTPTMIFEDVQFSGL